VRWGWLLFNGLGGGGRGWGGSLQFEGVEGVDEESGSVSWDGEELGGWCDLL